MSSKTRTRKSSTTDTTGSVSTLRSVPDQETAVTVRTDTEDKLWEALHANPNSTATNLSGVAKIGKSTAQKILVKWAADGSVTRTAGIAEGGRSAADLWAITEVDAALVDAAVVDQVDAAPVDDVDLTDTEQADTGSLATSDETDAVAATVDAAVVDQVDAAPADDTDLTDTAQAAQDSPVTLDATDIDDATAAESDPNELTNTEPTDAATDDVQGSTANTDVSKGEPIVAGHTEPADDGSATQADTAAGGDGDKARLAPGALRGMVEDYLRDHPGEEFGPTAIANALGGKSSGAVSNALDKLVEDKTAVKTNDKPRRFALAPAEAVAAPAPTS